MSTIAFIWDNFGPMHVDRCEAVQRRLAPKHTVVGIESYGTSAEYDWVPEAGSGFNKITVMSGGDRDRSLTYKTKALLRAIRNSQAEHVFFCNYNRPEIFLVAIASRLMGRSCYIMSCSKFDDFPRSLSREVLKSLFFLPYQGGIASGVRSRDYMRFLGVSEKRIFGEYNTLSIDRIRAAAEVETAPNGTPFAQRHFTIVARFVPKKNLSTALQAYALYAKTVTKPRKLHLCGSGPLEDDLHAKAKELGIADQVIFRGFIQSDAIAKELGSTLALLLPSVEEQFGNVVIEAQAMGLPVILSDNCGARDNLVRSGLNGFVVEADNPEGMAFFMSILCRDESTWKRFSMASMASATQGDTDRFAEAVQRLTC